MGKWPESYPKSCARTVTYIAISEMEMMQGAREQGMSESAIQYMRSALRSGAQGSNG